MSALWFAFKEGGVFNWVLLLLFGITLLATLILGVVALKRTKDRGWWLWIGPLLITLTVWVGYFHAMSKTSAAIAGESVSADLRSRIYAEGTSEALNLLLFGGFYLVVLLNLISVLMGVRSLRQQRGRFGLGAILALGAAVGLGAVSLVLRQIVIAKMGGWLMRGDVLPPVLSMPCWLATAIAATTSGAALSSAERDPERNGLAAGDALVALIAALAAMLLVVSFVHVREWSLVFGATSGESVDALQKQRIFTQGADEARAGFIGNSMLALPVVSAFGAALAARLSALGRGIARAWPALAAGSLVIFAFCLLPSVVMTNVVEQLETSR